MKEEVVNTVKFSPREAWGANHNNLYIEVVRWGFGSEREREINGENGIFNYYIYIYERFTPEGLFKKLWLKDKVTKFTPESYGYISHDYGKTPIANVNFHGGITFYQKIGHTKGFRAVKFGCDYNHFWDRESGVYKERVMLDAIDTAKQIENLIKNYK